MINNSININKTNNHQIVQRCKSPMIYLWPTSTVSKTKICTH